MYILYNALPSTSFLEHTAEDGQDSEERKVSEKVLVRVLVVAQVFTFLCQGLGKKEDKKR